MSQRVPPVAPAHLALLLDGLLPEPPLLLALLLVPGLRGDTGQVRVVDPHHALRLLGGGASGGEDVQRDARLAGHTDRLGLRTEGDEERSRLLVKQGK